MRFLLIAALFMGAVAPTVFAADVAPAADSMKAVNTVCPVCGGKVDAKIEPVVAMVDEKKVMIGCCKMECHDMVAKDAAKYAPSATANKQWKAEAQVK